MATTNDTDNARGEAMKRHICPIWVGYFLASRFRKLLQNPAKIANRYAKPGMTVLDFGCAMGFFSLPMAKTVGPEGKVVCVDVQPKMLDILKRRATRAGLAERIETHLCRADSVALDGSPDRFDFALAFAVLHEVPDQDHLLAELSQLVKPGARLLLAEPAGHITPKVFEQTITCARAHGFVLTKLLLIRWAHAALLTRTTA